MAEDKVQSKPEVKSSKYKEVVKEQEKKPKASFLFFQNYFYYIIIAEVVVVLLLGYLFLIKSQANNLFNSQKRQVLAEEQIKMAIQDYDEQIKQLEEIVDNYERISEVDIEAINTLLPDSASMEGLFTQINKIVKVNGLLLTGINISSDDDNSNTQKRSRVDIFEKASEETKSGEAIEKINFNLKISGVGYRSFKNLLLALESNLRIIDVQKIKYNPEDEVAEITITAYYLSS